MNISRIARLSGARAEKSLVCPVTETKRNSVTLFNAIL